MTPREMALSAKAEYDTWDYETQEHYKDIIRAGIIEDSRVGAVLSAVQLARYEARLIFRGLIEAPTTPTEGGAAGEGGTPP